MCLRESVEAEGTLRGKSRAGEIGCFHTRGAAAGTAGTGPEGVYRAAVQPRARKTALPSGEGVARDGPGTADHGVLPSRRRDSGPTDARGCTARDECSRAHTALGSWWSETEWGRAVAVCGYPISHTPAATAWPCLRRVGGSTQKSHRGYRDKATDGWHVTQRSRPRACSSPPPPPTAWAARRPRVCACDFPAL